MCVGAKILWIYDWNVYLLVQLSGCEVSNNRTKGTRFQYLYPQATSTSHLLRPFR